MPNANRLGGGSAAVQTQTATAEPVSLRGPPGQPVRTSLSLLASAHRPRALAPLSREALGSAWTAFGSRCPLCGHSVGTGPCEWAGAPGTNSDWVPGEGPTGWSSKERACGQRLQHCGYGRVAGSSSWDCRCSRSWWHCLGEMSS